MRLMISFVTSFVTALFFVSGAMAQEPIDVGPADWPWWRGPTRDGVADPKQKPPLTWSDTENVLWKVQVPGRGHGSPIVVGDQVFLATAENDRDTQSVLCFDRKTGEKRWQTDVHKGGLNKGGNEKSSLASSTPACDGKRVFINFMNAGGIHTTALDREGKKLWQTKVADYTLHQGFGSSPGLYKNLVLVSADTKGGTGAIAGLNRETGDVVWKRARPKWPNYASPIVYNLAGKDQLLLQGCKLVTSLNPATGDELWEIEGSTEECVTSTVAVGDIFLVSGGYPKNHVAAIKADGSGKVVWEKKQGVYVPSMLAHDGHFYAVFDGGQAVCWKADTGAELWKGRVEGRFSASLVLMGDTILATNEAGRSFLFKATPEKFVAVGENQLGNSALASPAVCGGRIYMRVAEQMGKMRQEWLVCLGAK